MGGMRRKMEEGERGSNGKLEELEKGQTEKEKGIKKEMRVLQRRMEK